MKILDTMKYNIALPTSVAVLNTYKDDIEISIADTLDPYLENETPDNPVFLTMNINTLSFLQRLIPENWSSDINPNTKLYYTNIEVLIDSHLGNGIINICTMN